MPRKSNQPLDDPMSKITVWVPQSLRDTCRKERLNMSGLAAKGLRNELERIGALE